MEFQVALPSKPRVVEEKGHVGIYEIDGLYPGYGHTLGNSLRRIILSSLPGAAITSVKIDGVSHEFSTMEGVKEDVITILLNLKRVRFQMLTDEPQIIALNVKGPKSVTAGDLTLPGQIQVLNPEQHIAEVTGRISLEVEVRVERGLGFVPKESHTKEKVDIGAIALDAIFTPIRRVNYEVENMRVGDRTDFNRLKLFIETDGTLEPRAALEKAIEVMINQLKAIIGFKEEVLASVVGSGGENVVPVGDEKLEDTEFLKTRIESLDLSARTVNALSEAGVRTVGGLARKKEGDILEIEGIGDKGLQEIRRALSNFGITLK